MVIKNSKIWVLFAVCIMFFAFAGAQDNSNIESKLIINNISKSLPLINEKIQQNNVTIPKNIQPIINDGNFSLNISMNDNSTTGWYLTIENETLTGIYFGNPEKSNYDFITNEDTVIKISQSTDAKTDVINAYKNGDIKIRAHGFWNNVKLFFAKIIVKFFT